MSVRPPDALCYVLREDPELAEAISPDRRAQAINECTAPEVWIEPGTRRPGSLAFRGGIGLLVLGGLLIRRVGLRGRFGAELLGPGDLLRPPDDNESPLLPLTTDWAIVQPTRIAALDTSFERFLARYPELAEALLARALQRSRSLAINMAIVNQARVDVRLQMLLWHLAARWGRVRGDGTVLRLNVTHSVLASLVAARRQTVTAALSELARAGLVRSHGDLWILCGDPPADLIGLSPVAREPADGATDAPLGKG